ncbi:MAG: serine/threonine-protein kinase [Myxococcota bacterium]|nr:serine/threonine-protein kinase [Myxococcota bacterium]
MAARQASFGSEGWFGRYRVDRRIGTGGMSQAWRGQLEAGSGFRKLVVIKVLHPEHVDDPSFVRMFMDEARLTARLSHPNIAQVYEAGEQDGFPYIAMEHVSGPDLTHVVKRLGGRIARPHGVCARIIAGVCRGLAAAHQQTDEDGRPLQIIHRDVSLGNVVMARTGAPKLIDFGIARWEEQSTVTEVGQLKGKLHYMAPEQLKDGYDHRVDIYQAGVCLYWLTTGRPPFHAQDPLTLWRERLGGCFPPPSELVAGYPLALERIVLRALATDPRDRFADAGEMAAALEAFCRPGSGWATRDADVAKWLESLFSAEEWQEWRPPRTELERTDTHHGTPADYTDDDATAGARTAKAHREGRYLSADSLAGGFGAAADPEVIGFTADEATTEPSAPHPRVRGVTRVAPPAPRPVRDGVPWRPVVVSARRAPLRPAPNARPWRTAGAAMVLALAGAVVGWLAGRHSLPETAASQIYLREARVLRAAGDLDGARVLAVRARASGVADPVLDVELLRLERQLGLTR